jgi:hypothetical protein
MSGADLDKKGGRVADVVLPGRETLTDESFIFGLIQQLRFCPQESTNDNRPDVPAKDKKGR